MISVSARRAISARTRHAISACVLRYHRERARLATVARAPRVAAHDRCARALRDHRARAPRDRCARAPPVKVRAQCANAAYPRARIPRSRSDTAALAPVRRRQRRRAPTPVQTAVGDGRFEVRRTTRERGQRYSDYKYSAHVNDHGY
jgi:hypothetical protein